MRFWAAVVFVLASGQAAAFSHNTVTVCVEDALAPGAGRVAYVEPLQQAGRRLGLEVRLQVMPWRRCLLSAEKGLVDAAAFTAYVGENMSRFAFPMAQERIDPARAMRRSRIMLYRRLGAAPDFDGTRLTPPNAMVGIRRGVVSSQLLVSRIGGRLDEGSEDFEVVLRKLVLERSDLAALSEIEADRMIAEKFPGKIEKLPHPLQEQQTYLAFNHAVYQRDSGLIERLWDELGRASQHK